MLLKTFVWCLCCHRVAVFVKAFSQTSTHQRAGGKADTVALGTLKVPSVGVGTISWSSDKLFKTENKEIESLVSTAGDTNTAFFDTAERYGSHVKAALGMGWGETESLLQKALVNVETETPPIIATKFTPTPWRTTVESVVEACEQSRDRLGVDQIDLYQLHMPDIVQPFRMFGKEDNKDEIYWEGLAECYKRGLVKNVGVCNYGSTLTMRCQEALAKKDVPLASNQIAYSLVGRHNGAQATLDKCTELGVQVLAFFPLGMGILTGKYSAKRSENELSRTKKTSFELRDLERYVKGDGVRVPKGGISPLLEIMERIAQERGKTVAQVALNYVVCKGAIPIPGARTRSQLIDNSGAMGWRLSDAEVGMLEQITDELGIGFEGAGFKRTSEKFVGYGVEKWSLA